ncbi:MAG TPA: sensor domain-containing diguanylate cyclase, partial [Candidatus Eremiobacteraceae bacterium]|nr:sensor domain-containing diguanylate cyclase [Candidatus Eremiobacteraceae bacterium]
MLPVGSALTLVVFCAAAYGAGALFSGTIGFFAGAGQALALALGPYLSSSFAMLARRSAEQQIRAINHVLDAGSDLSTKLSMPEVLTQLLNMLKQFRESVPWQNVIVYISRFDESSREELLCAEAIAGSHADFYRGSKLRFGEGLVGHAAMEQRPLIVADIQREQRDANLPKPKAVHGALIVPIVSETATIGCVVLTSSMTSAYTFDQQRLVDRLIRLASVAIQNARLHSKTLELAETDSMTGLFTNRAYQERLENEFRKAQTSKLSLALLIIDVDYFKHINDTYGHPQGDELLRQLGEVIRQHARRDDICCRYGGDEFTVVMPQTIKAEAAMVAGRIRQAIEDKVFALDGATAKITISIGVAGYPQDTQTKAALVKAADDALYAAKQSGRNNVKLANRLLLSPKAGSAAGTGGLRVPTPIEGPADPYAERPVRS